MPNGLNEDKETKGKVMQGYVLVMVLDDAYNLAYVHQAVIGYVT